MHYDLLQSTVADLGARPQAIDPETHDRVMATVSHVPHVLANALVSEAARALSEESERLPEVGTSFRDTTRVAGANPAIWGDIFATNSEAVAAGLDAIGARLSEAAELIRSGDADAVGRWHAAAGEDRRRLLESDLAGGDVRELRIGVENRPGAVAEVALALGHAQVNIEDMALYPAPDMRTGAISVWVAGAEEAARAEQIVRGLDHVVSVVADRRRRMTRFEPGGPLRGTLTPPPDKSISHRAALLAGFAEGETRIENFLLSADTAASANAVLQLGAKVNELGRGDGAATMSITGVGLRGAAPAEIDVHNAGTLLRLLPGLLAGQPEGEWTLDGDESIRRRPVDRVAEPLRLMGADDRVARRARAAVPCAARRCAGSSTGCRLPRPR